MQALSRQLLQYQGRKPETGLNSPVSVSGCTPCSDGPSLSASSCVGRSLASLLPSPSGALLGTVSSSFSCLWMKDSIAASDKVPGPCKSTGVLAPQSPLLRQPHYHLICNLLCPTAQQGLLTALLQRPGMWEQGCSNHSFVPADNFQSASKHGND